MKTLRLSAIVSIALALSACSGGGGSSSPAPTASIPPVTPPPQESSEYQGFIVPQKANIFTAESVQPTSHAQADKLVIENIEIALTPHFLQE